MPVQELKLTQIQTLNEVLKPFILGLPRNIDGTIVPITSFEQPELRTALHKLYLAYEAIGDFLAEVKHQEFRDSIAAGSEAASWLERNSAQVQNLITTHLFGTYPNDFARAEERKLTEDVVVNWVEHIIHCLKIGSFRCNLEGTAPSGIYAETLRYVRDTIPKDGLSDLAYEFIQEGLERLIK